MIVKYFPRYLIHHYSISAQRGSWKHDMQSTILEQARPDLIIIQKLGSRVG